MGWDDEAQIEKEAQEQFGPVITLDSSDWAWAAQLHRAKGYKNKTKSKVENRLGLNCFCSSLFSLSFLTSNILFQLTLFIKYKRECQLLPFSLSILNYIIYIGERRIKVWSQMLSRIYPYIIYNNVNVIYNIGWTFFN